MWGVEGMLRRARPNLGQGNIFVGNIESLEVAGGACELNGIVAQPNMFGGGLSTNRVTAGIEMVRP